MTLSLWKACMPHHAVSVHPSAHDAAALGRVVTYFAQSTMSDSVMLVPFPLITVSGVLEFH